MFGQGHYVGHDEPSTLFYSNVPGSGNRMNLFEVALTQSNPALGPLIDLLNPPDWSKIKSTFCPTPVTG